MARNIARRGILSVGGWARPVWRGSAAGGSREVAAVSSGSAFATQLAREIISLIGGGIDNRA